MNKPLTNLRKAPAQQRAAATFDAILDAAAHILRDGGVRALSTNKIAARAGVSIGSLYQYFPNKQSIARALIERHIARVERGRPAVLDDPGAPATAVMRAAVDWHFESNRMDPRLATALRELAAAVLPTDERERLVTLRRQRVGRTVTRLVGDATPERRERSVFLVDVCLGFIAQETMRHHPTWLNSADFRDEVTALLVASCGGQSGVGLVGVRVS
jgi:AcrR family transcriptional regulator